MKLGFHIVKEVIKIFQNGKQREFAEEESICLKCSLNDNCNVKPEHFGWRHVLTFCQQFNEKEEII